MKVPSGHRQVRRIGFDISQTGEHKAGCGFAAHGLLRGLAAVDRQHEYLLLPEFGGHRLHGEPPVAPSSRFRVADPGQPLAVDLVHANNFHCPVGLEARLVYTLYDLSFLDHPEWSTEANRIACFDGVFNASLYADLILAISQASRRHFLAAFPHFPEERVEVVPLGSRFEGVSGPVARPRALGAAVADGGFLLTVGTLEPRKNHRRLLSAYARYRRRHAGALPLVVAGGDGWLSGDLGASMSAAEGVHRLGYVDDAELLWLYRHCRLLVYPSLFEGFGLPALEAMAEGAPVISSRTSSLPEVVGDAGILVDPRDEEALAAALHIAHDGEELAELSRRAGRRAAAFSWRKSAAQVLELYRRVLDGEKLPAQAVQSRAKTVKVCIPG